MCACSTTFLSLHPQKHGLGKVLLDEVFRHLDLVETDFFGLAYNDKNLGLVCSCVLLCDLSSVLLSVCLCLYLLIVHLSVCLFVFILCISVSLNICGWVSWLAPYVLIRLWV